MPLPGIGQGFFNTIRETLTQTFQGLPVVIIIITAFLAASTANIGMIIVFLTQILVIPLIQISSGFLRSLSWVQRIFNLDPELTYDKINKYCSFSPVDVKPDMVPPVTSYWMANILFFTSYLLMNGVTMFTVDSEVKNASPTKVENRKAHAMSAILITFLVFFVLIWNYAKYMSCETPGSVTFAMLVYVPLGYGVFKLAEYCGIRTADTFGIAPKLFLPAPGQSEFPFACVNIEKK